MDKDLKELLDNLKDKLMEEMDNKLNEAKNIPCEISVKTNKKGGAEVKVKGNKVSLLIALAGLENSVLKQLKTSENEFKMFKSIVNTEEEIEVL
ncbi:MAG: hypothetical protein IJL74_00665 [Bacilli bacterium]|nr:hypothetical protein [Bacilli bacterium]